MKKKIVYLHRYPLEFESEQFAAAISLMNLFKKKYDVTYFSMGSCDKNKKLYEGINFIEIPFKVNRFNSRDKWIKTILYYFFLPGIFLRLKKINPDFIICKETLPFIPSIIARINKPMLIDISDWWWSILFGNTKLGKKFANFIEKIEVKDWNKYDITAITHLNVESDMMVKKGMNSKKIVLISPPQHKEYFPINDSNIRKKLGFKKNDWIVAMHGIIHPSKGYDQIIGWWNKLAKIHPNWKLLIMGGSGMEEWCRKRINELKLDKSIIMTGWIPKTKDVNLRLNASDCLLVTRRNTQENFGVFPSSLYHNLAIGKPTLATGLPAMCEILKDKINGYTFKPDNFESFKSSLEYIYKNPKIARKVAKKGIETAEESFNPENCANKYLDVIDKALSDN